MSQRDDPRTQLQSLNTSQRFETRYSQHGHFQQQYVRCVLSHKFNRSLRRIDLAKDAESTNGIDQSHHACAKQTLMISQ
jgi:hypothetical protein